MLNLPELFTYYLNYYYNYIIINNEYLKSKYSKKHLNTFQMLLNTSKNARFYHV